MQPYLSIPYSNLLHLVQSYHNQLYFIQCNHTHLHYLIPTQSRHTTQSHPTPVSALGQRKGNGAFQILGDTTYWNYANATKKLQAPQSTRWPTAQEWFVKKTLLSSGQTIAHSPPSAHLQIQKQDKEQQQSSWWRRGSGGRGGDCKNYTLDGCLPNTR